MSKIVKMKVGNVRTGMRRVISKQQSEHICETHIDKANKLVEIVSVRADGTFHRTTYDNLHKKIEVRP